MSHRDYRKEAGVAPSTKNAPKAVTIIVLIVVIAVVSYSVRHVLAETDKHHAKTAPAAAAAPGTAPAD